MTALRRHEPVRLISFDLDGTLADTASEIAEAVHLTFDALGIGRRPEREIVDQIGQGSRELMRKLLARMHADGTLAGRHTPDVGTLLVAFELHYTRTAGRFARLYPGCDDTLRRLLDHGVKLVCVTNKNHRHALRVLEATGIAGRFQSVVGGDTLAVKKPDAAVLAHVLHEAGEMAAHAAHVGDSAIDVAAARNAGVRAWAVPWGYNAGVPVADSRPDRLFDRLSDIADCVCG